jgi:ppGpp synthetase/RelA/SpoT-type nucleotidyltranferase
MAQVIRPPSGNVRRKGLHSKINKVLSAARGIPLKSAFLRDVWPRLEGDYDLMVSNLIAHCENLVRERNISAKVDGRVKAAQSIDKTLDRRLQHRIANQLGAYRSVEEMFHDMHDLAGIRIVVDYPSQLEPANRLIEEAFWQGKSPNIFTRERPVGKEWDAWFGAYQSYNHHISVKNGTQGILGAYRNVVFEVQLTSSARKLVQQAGASPAL